MTCLPSFGGLDNVKARYVKLFIVGGMIAVGAAALKHQFNIKA